MLEERNGLGGAGHVRALGHREASVAAEALGVLEGQIVLGRTGQRNFTGDRPDAGAFGISGARHPPGVL